MRQDVVKVLETSRRYKCESGAEPSVAESHLNFIRVELLLMPQHESLLSATTAALVKLAH